MPTLTSVTNHFITGKEGFTTTTSGSVASGATTVGLNSVSGYTNGDSVAFVIDPTDANKKQVFTGTIDTSGVQVTDVVWTEGTNQTHAAGATVVDYTTATHQAALVKGLLVSHNQDGTIIPEEVGGAWQSWTPTFTNMSGGTLSNNRYTQIGKTIIGQFKYTMSGANVSGAVSFTLPETARSGAMTNSYVKLTKYLTADYFGFINGNIIAVFNSSSTYIFKSNITATVPFTWGANDFIEVMIIYEAA